MKLNWIVKLLTRVTWAKNNGDKIKKYISSKHIQTSSNLDCIDRSQIRVCAVQQEIQLMKNYKQYVDRMHEFVDQGVREGAQLIVFPEYNGALILGMLPLVETILKRLIKQKSKSADKNSTTAIISKQDKDISTDTAIESTQNASIDMVGVLSILTPFLLDIFKTTFSELALHYGVYIMSGSIMVAEGDSIYNRAYLFDPDGKIVGNQDKLHLVMMERAMGMSMGKDLSVYNTPIGKLAFPVCMDASYFETFKIAKDKGAHIVMIPIANMEEYHDYLALRGIWPRVQESGVYGIRSALVGELYGIKFTGKAGIFAPLTLTPDGDGVLKLSKSYDRDEIIVCDLDLYLIERYYDPYFSDQNIEFINKYYPSIYEKLRPNNER
ncbi:MAG: hypothetical protein GX783_13770 [Clostridiales bacterium]|nr:hypothetical protein [Clostridiales bacterium]